MLDLQLAPSAGRSLPSPVSPSSGVALFVRPFALAADAVFQTQGDRDALMERYSHLVKYVVGRLGVSIQGVFDREDAMQAGSLGLLRAIGAYKPGSVASFESYAIVRIRGSILDAVRTLDPVGRAGREFARSIGATISTLQAELDRVPTPSEIAERLGISVNRYYDRLRTARIITVSLDQPDSRDGDEPAGIADEAVDLAAIDPEAEATRRDDLVGLVGEIGRLGERQRRVLSMYYIDELTFKQIGEVLGVTESRICQIHTQMVLALRSRMVDPDIASRVSRRRATSKSASAAMAPMTTLNPGQLARPLGVSQACELREELPPAA
jgi:RNA polymerase sigma factor for flagellar operon FliA